MAMQLRWVGVEECDRVAEARMRCYAPAASELPKFKESIAFDHGTKPTDFLLAEVDGEAVGTATSVKFGMWVRGHRVPCQGVAYVGTIKTHRRSGAGEKGIASQLMNETLKRARDQGMVASALHPFRASYYEHFGYGIVERRVEWTLPLAVLPSGDFSGMRFYREGGDDLAALLECKQRITEAGQCDIERTQFAWEWHIRKAADGFLVIDRDARGIAHGWLRFYQESEGGKDRVRVSDRGHDSIDALVRQLRFLTSLRDQYDSALLTLPVDVPLNWMLKETQLPHRAVNHAAASARPYTRMQIRILDHKSWIEGMNLPDSAKGRAVVAVTEPEGNISKFEADISGGRGSVRAVDTSANFECPARVWAAVASGDLDATTALRLGLASGEETSANVLDAFAIGPKPYTHEYF